MLLKTLRHLPKKIFYWQEHTHDSRTEMLPLSFHDATGHLNHHTISVFFSSLIVWNGQKHVSSSNLLLFKQECHYTHIFCHRCCLSQQKNKKSVSACHLSLSIYLSFFRVMCHFHSCVFFLLLSLYVVRIKAHNYVLHGHRRYAHDEARMEKGFTPFFLDMDAYTPCVVLFSGLKSGTRKWQVLFVMKLFHEPQQPNHSIIKMSPLRAPSLFILLMIE